MFGGEGKLGLLNLLVSSPFQVYTRILNDDPLYIIRWAFQVAARLDFWKQLLKVYPDRGEGTTGC